MYFCNQKGSHFLKNFLFIFFIYIIGKSFLLKVIASTAMEFGLNVCISAPTRKLASTYAQEFPSCQCNTIHINYFVPIDKTKQPNTINWSLADVHVLLGDEVSNTFPCLTPCFYQQNKVVKQQTIVNKIRLSNHCCSYSCVLSLLQLHIYFLSFDR